MRTVLVHGLVGGLAIAALQFVEYRFLVIEHSIEIYGGFVALLFSALGIWLGLRLTRPKVIVRDGPFVPNQARLAELGITPRELEGSSRRNGERRPCSSQKAKEIEKARAEGKRQAEIDKEIAEQKVCPGPTPAIT